MSTITLERLSAELQDLREKVVWLAECAGESVTQEPKGAAAIVYEFNATLDTYGAPPGDTVHDRLWAWEQRERALRAELRCQANVLENIVRHGAEHAHGIAAAQLARVKSALEPTDA